MALILKEILKKSREQYQLTLIAGSAGINNYVSWIYITEDINNTDFLRGNELIITTGMLLKNEETLFHFIKTMHSHNCSGIILNIGKYIHKPDISQSILLYCDNKKIPLFLMPWEIHISDVMQDYCLQISRQLQKNDIVTLAFQSAISSPDDKNHYIPALIQNGFELNGTYRIVIIYGLFNITRIRSFLTSYVKSFFVFPYETNCIIVFQTIDNILLQKIISDFFILLQKRIQSTTTIGIGNEVTSLTSLHTSYRQADFALHYALFYQKSYSTFNQLGIFQIFSQFTNIQLLESMYKQQLGKLEEYDKKNHSEYMETLRYYITNNGSIQKTAQCSATHRNTINYRIQKIKSILEIDLSSIENLFQLFLAFYIKDYLNLKKDL
ncbi:PucR family transcriptional regulator [Anaeromicropila populeti]|uniref:PucR C-terminal helix-turn-helix domain-containing protein n=1 Tax=Anaeromicropila populeti TaxID=37658 RepID=A0A1I6LNL8_9FIRM|nr:PucR family transcriptional regulator [Anaeromicropila populeti]SFS05117.1 PucR C-terminal helix-turn-helix domain-containing protein [Anaeromicropila populeti]